MRRGYDPAGPGSYAGTDDADGGVARVFENRCSAAACTAERTADGQGARLPRQAEHFLRAPPVEIAVRLEKSLDFSGRSQISRGGQKREPIYGFASHRRDRLRHPLRREAL